MRQRPRSHRTYAAIVTLAVATALGVAAAPAGANVGSVYFDLNGNAAAGETLFNGTFTGLGNVGLGREVMPNLTSGGGNIAVGAGALGANTAGSNNVAIGQNAGINLTAGSNNIAIANLGVGGQSGAIRIGTAGTHTAIFLAGVWGKAIGGQTQTVIVNGQGRLGTAPALSAPQSQTRTITRLRDRVAQLEAAVQLLQKEVRTGG
jgi:hypothetical protein